MKKYLFVVSRYGHDIQTNGLVLSSIIDELNKSGDMVICLSESDKVNEYDYKGAKVYTIRQGLYSCISKKNRSIGNFLEVILHLLFFFSYPSYDKLTELRMYNKICELDKLYGFDCIYAIYRKYTNIGATLRFKKANRERKSAILFFDLIEANKPKYYSTRIFSAICRKKYRSLSSIFDKIYIPDDVKSDFGNLIQPEKREVLHYPGFVRRKVVNTTTLIHSKKTLAFVFAGTLDENYRNPMPLFEVLRGLKDIGYSINLRLFVKGNCDGIIETASKKLDLDITRERIIEKERLLVEYQYADVLINISNHIIKATPSKVFELISTGKPIINIVFDEEDTTSEVFDKYLMAINIFAYKSIPNQIKQLAAFLDNAHDLSEDDYSIVEKRFENNTPYRVSQSIKF